MENNLKILTSHGIPLKCSRIKNFWEIRTDHSLNSGSAQFVLPSINNDLIFIIKGSLLVDNLRIDMSFLSPVLQNWKSIHIEPDTILFGIRLNPANTRIILDLTMDQLHQGPNPLDKLLNNSKLSEIERIIHNSSSFYQRISQLDDLFLHFFTRKENNLYKTVTNCLHVIHRNPDMNVSKLSAQTGYSERWLQKLFLSYVGINPGEVIRISRFNRLLGMLNQGKFTNLTEIGYANGYSDQSHMIRDFKKYAAASPKHYVHDFPGFIEIMNCR